MDTSNASNDALKSQLEEMSDKNQSLEENLSNTAADLKATAELKEQLEKELSELKGKVEKLRITESYTISHVARTYTNTDGVGHIDHIIVVSYDS